MINQQTTKDAHSILPGYLPGIDMPSALKCLGDTLFRKVLKEFRNRYKHSIEEIESALLKGDLTLARRLAHTIKGVSGIFSANNLFSTSRELEDAIINNNLDQLDTLFPLFKTAFSEVLESANQLEEQEIKSSPLEQEMASAGEVTVEIANQMKELDELLEKNNPKAEHVLILIKPQLISRGFQYELHCIEERISSFDFKAARQELKYIIETMNK